jgi:glycosyltransferase involved in cell wall biosynthesis
VRAVKPRVAIITEIIAPYRVPVFNRLARNTSVETRIIFLSETDRSLREWHIYTDEIQFSYDVLPNWRCRIAGYNALLNWDLDKHLEKISPDILICGGYSYVASWHAARWCHRHGVPLVLWSESTGFDQRGGFLTVEFLKRQFLRKCRAFAVPGRSAFDYLVSFGIPGEAIVTAPNAVDNQFFEQRARIVRANAAHYRARYDLPERFFLYCGRLTRSKGVFDAIDAYASLAPDLRSQVSIVFAGNGPAKLHLQRRAASIHPGHVRFAGFVHREDLAAFYALADMLIFPTHSDPWGLVVNEAMASGLPIITTSVAGCAADLVQNGRNGSVVEPGAVDQLASAMDILGRNHERRSRFGADSVQKIISHSPEACAAGLLAAVDLVNGKIAYA